MYSRLFIVALVVMCMSHTLSKERIFESLRARLGGRDTWLGYLVCCPYCNSHWLAFVMVPLTDTYVVPIAAGVAATPRWLLSWFLSSIAVAAVAAVLRVLFYFVDEGQGLLRREIKKTDATLEDTTPP